MNRFGLSVVAGFALLAPFSAQAQIYDASIPIPDSEVILNFNGTGLDWVYAGPIAPNEFGPGQIQPASYRASEGWRVASLSEWSLRPTWSDFTRPGFATPSPNSGFSDHASYRFASEYWSTFTHVDLNDFAAGRVTDGVNGLTSNVPETIYVRLSLFSSAVPEPATWAMLVLGFGLVGGALRARQRRTLSVSFS